MKRIILIVSLLMPVAALAGGGGSEGVSQKASAPNLQEIKMKIEASKYAEAIKLLKAYIREDDSSADAYNYLGFSYRKGGQLPEAFEAYRKALALDPKHLGAHEYLGEAYLASKQPEKARGELAQLKSICGNCEEYRDLQKSITSAGNL